MAVDQYGRILQPTDPVNYAAAQDSHDRWLLAFSLAVTVVSGFLAAHYFIKDEPISLMWGAIFLFFGFGSLHVFNRLRSPKPGPAGGNDIDHFREPQPYGSASYAKAEQIDRALRGQGGGSSGQGGPAPAAEPPKFMD